MSRNPSATAPDLERYRPYLRLLGRLADDEKFMGKLDLSGVVQQTMLDAIKEQSLPTDADKLRGWLATAFKHNLLDEVRRLTTMGRDVRREQSLEASLQQSSARIDGWLKGSDSSPSARLAREEELCRLAVALERLPDKQRRAIELHHLKGCSLVETAAALGSSKDAVAGQVYRGLTRLRELLTEAN